MNLKTEIVNRAELFNTFWQRYLKKEEPATLYDAVRHLPLAGGKRLRPFLAMMACEGVGGTVEQVLPFAAGVELMHNFTLVHDDIMDHSELRRNLPTVHVQFTEATAILAGDFLFARSFEALHDLSIDLSVLKELERDFIRCILDICEGQQLDVEFERQKRIAEDAYLGMIRKKTAVLFQLAGKGGAITGGGTAQQVTALAEYGIHLGLSFQIWDDFLDMSSTEDTLGKDIGNDIRNGKKTLIAVYALQHATGQHQHILDQYFGNPNASEEEIKQIFSVFEEIGAVDYARDAAMSYTKSAKESLTILPDSLAKERLLSLADYSIQREM